MRKTVDVFLRDRLVASYPVVVTGIDRPADEDYTGLVKHHMRRLYDRREIAIARFIVRGPLD